VAVLVFACLMWLWWLTGLPGEVEGEKTLSVMV